MKQILILGAGMVAGPTVEYLCEDHHILLVDKNEKNIHELMQKIRRISGKETHKITTITGDKENDTFTYEGKKTKLKTLIQKADIVISLLPATMHTEIARQCIECHTHLVTASYTSLEMEELGKYAEEKGIALINECGVDPGIDHMSAMKLIDGLRRKGEKILSFTSYCGGLPAVKSTNPLNYQFSWSPLGVLRAGKSSAMVKKNEDIITIASGTLFEESYKITILGEEYEAYYNRNSLPYMQRYQLEEAHTFIRATLRYPGWSEIMNTLEKLHYLEEMKQSLGGVCYRTLLRTLIGHSEELETAGQARKAAATYLDIKYESPILEKLAWLGLFSSAPIDEGVRTPIVALNRLMLKKMSYNQGQRDMLIMHHEIETEQQHIQSTLRYHGETDDFSAMATTVGLPVAYITELLLQGKINKRGVVLPTTADIYEPILAKLEEKGITFQETILQKK